MAVILARKVIKSTTNGGDPAKHYFEVVKSRDKKLETVLFINRLTLASGDFEMYDKKGFTCIKKFKGKRLYQQEFAMKMSTVHEVFNWLTNK